MTHEFTGTLPAHDQHRWVENPTENAPKNGYLTHQMTHAFGSLFSHEMSVFTGIASKFLIEIFLHFFLLFRTVEKLRQTPAGIMTQLLLAACSLIYSLTFKTVIL